VKRAIILVMGLAATAGASDTPEWARPAPAPEIEPLYALVDVNALNLRDAPSVDGNRIGLLHRGDRVEVLAWGVGYDSRESDYVWAEVRSGGVRGYVAAEESNYGWGEFGERYLVVEHDFGEPELALTADLDSDGTPEDVWVGPGELFHEDEPYRYVTYFLPLVLRVEGSFATEARLAEFYMEDMEPAAEDTPEEELLTLLMDDGWSSDFYHWSLYDLEAGDFNGDGEPELRLTLDARPHNILPISTPTFTHRRVLGFAWDGDDLRNVYAYTTQGFFLGIDEEGLDGAWAYVEGGAELTPEVLRYHAVMCRPGEPPDAHRFRTIHVHAWLNELDRVRHPLPPPDYLADGLWYTTDLEAKWVSEAGIYALYCPPGNRYGRELGCAYSGVSPRGLLGLDPSESVGGVVDESLTLYCLPGSGEAAGVLEAGVRVDARRYETRDGDWYLVSAIPYAATNRGAPALAGWTRIPPETEE
jgi:hypothetical protein